MSLVAFDTLKFATQLQEGNFTPEQARAMTSAMVEAMAGAELATKSDIAAVKASMTAMEDRLDAKMGANKAELKADIAAVKHELEQKIDGTKHELEQKIDGTKLELERRISESHTNTQRFILATVVINAAVVLGAMLGLVKLLGH